VPAPPLSPTFATRAAFIDVHGDRTRLWVSAETAVKCADHTPLLIDRATKTLENALPREGMLD